MTKPLKPLDAHNAECLLFARYDNNPHPNGLACPTCGSELIDSSPMVVLCSNPPPYHVHCSANGCPFKGYRG